MKTLLLALSLTMLSLTAFANSQNLKNYEGTYLRTFGDVEVSELIVTYDAKEKSFVAKPTGEDVRWDISFLQIDGKKSTSPDSFGTWFASKSYSKKVDNRIFLIYQNGNCSGIFFATNCKFYDSYKIELVAPGHFLYYPYANDVKFSEFKRF